MNKINNLKCPSWNARVFISDVHGQRDVFEYLVDSKFGLVRQLVIDECSEGTPEANIALIERSILSDSTNIHKETEHYYDCQTAIKIQIAILLRFKFERKFWSICVEQFSSCSWMLGVIDGLIFTANIDDQDFAVFSSLEPRECRQLMGYIGGAIKRLVTFKLNVVGDIYDRGDDAYSIIEHLSKMDDVAVQWGNHDVLWIGAASGCLACIAIVVRVCLRYNNINSLCSDYGFDLAKLQKLALTLYNDDPCSAFMPKGVHGENASDETIARMAKMHKAIAMIQFKLEDDLIARHPEYYMDDNRPLKKLNFVSGDAAFYDNENILLDKNFPSLNPDNLSLLTSAEKNVIENLKYQFVNNEKLHKHIEFLLANGGMYGFDEDYLLYHGCVPLADDGEFSCLSMEARPVKGRVLFDTLELQVRKAYSRRHSQTCKYLSDVNWYLWCGPASPLFGKDKMTTFERYFISDKSYHFEGKNHYFNRRDDEKFIDSIVHEFSRPKGSVVINGHVPVKVSSGEPVVKANGRMLCIDGGFSQAYRSTTGVAGIVAIKSFGCELIYNLVQKKSGYQYQYIVDDNE